MINIALHEPQIAPNTGNIIRLTANTGFNLHLIEPFGFTLDDKKLRRAGLDYHDLSRLSTYKNYGAFLKEMKGHRIYGCTTKATRYYSQINFRSGDVLLFGSETSGLPSSILEQLQPDHLIRVPMQANSRSLNLSNAVSVIAYEAWRQNDFVGGI